MRKIIAVVLFSLLAFNINASDLINVKWTAGNFGFGVNYSPKSEDNTELTTSVLSFNIEPRDFNMGFEFSPVKYWQLSAIQQGWDKKHEKFSFMNANVYFNLLGNRRVMLGPFVSMNYFFMDAASGMELNDYIFTSGLRFFWRPDVDNLPVTLKEYQLFSFEVGYRNMRGEHRFYSSLYVDVLLVLYSVAVGLSLSSEHSVNNSRDRIPFSFNAL